MNNILSSQRTTNVILIILVIVIIVFLIDFKKEVINIAVWLSNIADDTSYLDSIEDNTRY